MTDTEEKLQQHRHDIDQIDDQIIELLKKRIETVSQVGAIKREAGETGVFIRPGREGRMHKRIFEAFSGSDFPPRAALQIWRMLISASTDHESPLAIGATYSADEPDLYWMAREYFGNFVNVQPINNSNHVIADIQDKKLNVGVLPFPQDTVQWWLSLAQYQTPSIYIFAKLPLIEHSKQEPTGLAIANVMPEPTNPDTLADDYSYYVISADDTISTSKLQGVWQSGPVKSTFLSVASHPPMRSLLVRLDGFVSPEHPMIAAVTTAIPEARIRWLGAHSKSVAV